MEQMLSRSHVFWLLGAVLVVLLVYLIGPVLTPFFIALFIAYVSNPGVSYLEKAGVPRWASMLTGVVFVLVIVGLTSFLFLPTLQIQLSEYLDRIPSYLNQFRAWTDPYISKLTSVAAKVTDADQGSVGSVTDLAKTALPSGVGGQAGAATVDLAKTSTVVLIQVITNIFLIPVIAFYLLRDWNSITTNLKRALPAAQRTRVVGLARKVDRRLCAVLKSFLYGQLLVMISLGAMYSIGLMVIGLEFSLLIGVIAGILSFVPFLGTAIGLVMASVAMITQVDTLIDLWKVFLVFGIGQFIEGNILTPKLVGEQLGLHPVIVIFSVLAGGHLFGFSGILLALPVAAVMWVLIKSLSEDPRTD